MTEKSSFYRSAGRAFVTEVEENSANAKRAYNNVERRRGMRRSLEERRQEIRFDLKGDRRETPGRREQDKAPKFW
ncbi:MAG: hypothetical protein KDI09_15630 [Halioglobus sp.]|nr:hypothetical protein [Halioglobus sp.]